MQQYFCISSKKSANKTLTLKLASNRKILSTFTFPRLRSVNSQVGEPHRCPPVFPLCPGYSRCDPGPSAPPAAGAYKKCIIASCSHPQSTKSELRMGQEKKESSLFHSCLWCIKAGEDPCQLSTLATRWNYLSNLGLTFRESDLIDLEGGLDIMIL